jgi:amidase
VQVLGKDKVIYSFNQKNEPAYFVDDGEIFRVETDDCYHGQIRDESVLRPDIDISIMDCSVGPIWVNGAEPDDVLCVEILGIDFAPQGVMVLSPGLGVLGEKIDKPRTKVIPIVDGYARFSDTLVLPLTPMVGVLGVAPRSGDIHCAVPGDHGSNMDTRVITVGSKVYLPVAVKGALLAAGDLHACMGDGELSGTGIETAGSILMKTTVLKGVKLRRPMVETKESIYTIASSQDFEEGVRMAAEDMTAYLARKMGIGFQEAYMLLSAVCHIQISQVVNELYTFRVQAPKALLKLSGI